MRQLRLLSFSIKCISNKHMLTLPPLFFTEEVQSFLDEILGHVSKNACYEVIKDAMERYSTSPDLKVSIAMTTKVRQMTQPEFNEK